MRMFIGNIPLCVDEPRLKDWLREHGLASAHGEQIIRDRESKDSRGFGFFNVDAREADAASRLDKADLDGRQVVVNAATPKRFVRSNA